MRPLAGPARGDATVQAIVAAEVGAEGCTIRPMPRGLGERTYRIEPNTMT
jgi:hypothetical protein